MENEFYLRDTRSNVGSSCTFWALNGCGYTTNLDKAEVFTHAEAQEFADRGEHFIPLSKAQVDALATVRVDMQLLKWNFDFSEGVVVHRYVGQYDGNDIFFDDGSGKRGTANYNEAKVYGSINEVMAIDNQCGHVLSKKFLDSICRRTLQFSNVNRRKMVTAAGIKYRSPRRPRKTTGKYRGNCPACGKITWDYDPHENAPCGEHRQGW